HFVGDIFGAPLAIEGLMAFFLEATFVGLMFFGWDKLSKLGHLFVTCMVALGTNLSALWILVANGWMQNPVGASFNPDTMRMEITSFYDVIMNPVAQAKFVHTVSAGYVTASVFVLGVSAWYLLKGRHLQLARRSFAVAAAFGLASSLSVVVLGDESGYVLTDNQRMKLAAIEAMWHTEPAPAGFTAVGIPNMEAQRTDHAIHIPYVLGIIATRSLTGEVKGISELVDAAEVRIRRGILAYDALERLKADRSDMDARATFEEVKADIGYGYLLKRFVEDPRAADEATIRQAAWSTVPHVPTLFWAFRLMAGAGFLFILVFAYAFWLATRHDFSRTWFLKLAVVLIPLPWLASQAGWLVAELGRQPWVVEGALPTFLGVSSITLPQIWTTIAGFTLLYGALAVLMVRLMVAAIRKGPETNPRWDEPAPAAPARGEGTAGAVAAGYVPMPAE
ncbi:MAG: cytochrome ubiquinol oxidase subunit I, partial [Sphingomonadaceae bacterium]